MLRYTRKDHDSGTKFQMGLYIDGSNDLVLVNSDGQVAAVIGQTDGFVYPSDCVQWPMVSFPADNIVVKQWGTRDTR